MGRAARGLRQEASLGAVGVGGKGWGAGAGPRSEPSALGFGGSSFSPPGGDRGRPPSAPLSFLSYSRALQPSAARSHRPARTQPAVPRLVRGPWRGVPGFWGGRGVGGEEQSRRGAGAGECVWSQQLNQGY